MNKYEQLIEHIINDDESKARALFHSIVVERSREIYESLMDEEPHHPSHDQVGNLVDEIGADEHGMHEEDEEMSMPGDDMSGEPGMDMGGEMDGMDAGGDGSAPATKDDIMDLESAIDELKAEFDRLMGDEAGDEEEPADGEDDGEEGGENPFAGDDAEEPADDEEADEEEEDAVAEGKMPMKSVDGKKVPAFAADGKGKNDMSKGKDDKKSDSEKLREYVDKLGDIYKQEPTRGEGKEIAASGKHENINKQSLVAGKNDMGGTSANILRGGTEQDPDGKAYKAPSNEYAKGRGNLPHAGQFENVPGANAGKAYSKKEGSYENGGKGQGNPTGHMAGTGKNTPASGDAYVKSPLNGAPKRAK
jgi:hypothetical protein